MKGALHRGALAAMLVATALLAVPVDLGGGGPDIAVAPQVTDPAAAQRQRRVGLASYYAHRFAGRTMADGTPMRPESNNAASRTLPLGTVALVRNLVNGRSELVTIRDRGPYVRGRIIDLSPATARYLGMLEAGVVKVEVIALHVPGAKRRPDLLASSAGSAGSTRGPARL